MKKYSHRRLISVLVAFSILFGSLMCFQIVPAQAAAMTDATLTFVGVDVTGNSSATDLVEPLSQYNECAIGTTGQWGLLDRYLGLGTDSLGATATINGTLSSAVNYLIVDWDKVDQRFEIVRTIYRGMRYMFDIPENGFVLFYYGKNTNFPSLASHDFFKNQNLVGKEVRVQMNSMMATITGSINDPGNVYQTYNELLSLRQGKTLLKAMDTYVSENTDLTKLTGAPVEVRTDGANQEAGADSWVLYNADNTVELPTDTGAFYIPLIPVDGKVDVYKVGTYADPTTEGGVTPPTMTSIPANGYLLAIRYFLPHHISNSAGKLDTKYTQNIKKYFAADKEFKLVTDTTSGTMETQVTIAGSRYDVYYMTDTDAGSVQKNNQLSLVAASDTKTWTAPFNATTTAEAIVVNGFVSAFGTAESGTYIPANGYVLSGTGSMKSRVASLAIGDTVLFTKIPEPVYTQADVLYKANTFVYSNKNIAPAANSFTLFDSTYTAGTTGTGSAVFEIVADASGNITKVGGNNNTIPSGGFVLSGNGTAATALQSMDYTSMQAKWDKTHGCIAVYLTPKMLADTATAKLAQYQATLADAQSMLKDLPYSVIGQAITNATGNIAGVKDLMNVGTDATKKANFFTEITAALQSMNTEVNQIAQLIVPTEVIENRAIWVEPTQTTKAEVRAALEQMQSININTVYVGAWIAGHTTFKSDNQELKMWPEVNDFDALGAYVEVGHELGMEIHAWVDGLRIGVGSKELGLKDPKAYLAQAHPEWLLFSRGGADASLSTVNNTNTYYLNPMNEEVVERITSVYKEIITKYDVDGVQYDNIHFPDPNTSAAGESINDFGFNDEIMDAYTDKYGSLPFLIDEAHEEWNQWCAFKAEVVSNFVYRATTELKSLRPELKVQAAVAPDFGNASASKAQDAINWVKKGYIDSLVPRAFYRDTNAVVAIAKDAYEKLNGKAYLSTGIDAASGYPANTVVEQVQAIRSLGNSAISLFSYEQMVSNNYFPALKEVVFRDKTIAIPENVKDSIPAAMAELQRKLIDVYSKYDTDHKTQYDALSFKVTELSNYLKTCDYSLNNSTEIITKLNALIATVKASAAPDMAKTSIEADLNRAIEWLTVYGNRLSNWENHKLTELSFELDLAGDAVPLVGKAYAVRVKAKAEFGDDSVEYLLSKGQYNIKALSGNFTISNDGLLTYTAEGEAKMEITVSSGYKLNVAQPGKAFTFVSEEAVDIGSTDNGGNNGGVNNGGEDNVDTGENTQAVSLSLFALLVTVVALTAIVIGLRRKQKA